MDEKEVKKIIEDYQWMINSIKKTKEFLGESTSLGASHSGIESPLPKPQGTTRDLDFHEIIMQERQRKKIEEYTNKVKFIHERMHLIKDNREIEILYWLLEGQSYSWISRHMRLSVTHTRRLSGNIVSKIANATDWECHSDYA